MYDAGLPHGNRGLCPGGIGGKREDYHRRFRHTAYPGEESAGY